MISRLALAAALAPPHPADDTGCERDHPVRVQLDRTRRAADAAGPFGRLLVGRLHHVRQPSVVWLVTSNTSSQSLLSFVQHPLNITFVPSVKEMTTGEPSSLSRSTAATGE